MSRAKNVLEIGTNLGISGQYFIKGLECNEETNFITLEGLTRLCEMATERFSELTLNKVNFNVLQGFYDQTLPSIIASDKKFDVVFIDGNHKYEPTIKYYNLLKNSLSDSAILIFDDINWSSEMIKVWKVLKQDKNARYSINLFKLGILIYEKDPINSNKDSVNLFLS